MPSSSTNTRRGTVLSLTSVSSAVAESLRGCSAPTLAAGMQAEERHGPSACEFELLLSPSRFQVIRLPARVIRRHQPSPIRLRQDKGQMHLPRRQGFAGLNTTLASNVLEPIDNRQIWSQGNRSSLWDGELALIERAAGEGSLSRTRRRSLFPRVRRRVLCCHQHRVFCQEAVPEASVALVKGFMPLLDDLPDCFCRPSLLVFDWPRPTAGSRVSSVASKRRSLTIASLSNPRPESVPRRRRLQ